MNRAGALPLLLVAVAGCTQAPDITCEEAVADARAKLDQIEDQRDVAKEQRRFYNVAKGQINMHANLLRQTCPRGTADGCAGELLQRVSAEYAGSKLDPMLAIAGQANTAAAAQTQMIDYLNTQKQAPDATVAALDQRWQDQFTQIEKIWASDLCGP